MEESPRLCCGVLQQIDRMLVSAGWAVQDAKAVNLYAKQGVAIREFELKPGFGTADYMLYVDGQAAGVIEVKKKDQGDGVAS